MSIQNRGSERQIEMVALNAKWKRNDGSEWQMENEQWLWTPKRNNGSERQTKLNNHERQAEKDDSERRN